ncbi:prostamide/prostaglandin F synthase isoform X1 [Rhipicephalus sanguineus]|uniref:prostamide/prostaglandin F synthase isoform X1 n=1 Tax=Rhipicephalus sanguineus TaxID=34632 RepID=UPI001894067A|nr:prostamide/prostaglandin F synthase isoform X1 [Rhipicephalus sanguineus]
MAFAMRLSFPFIYRGLILFADVSKVPAEEEEMNAAQLIGKFTLKEVSSGKSVTVESLWRDQTCVLMFFRRWACPFCRLDAVRLSRIKPQLDAAGVRLVGIGHENIGLEDFRRGEYFKGELYVDEERNAYKALQYKRFSWFTIIPAILTSSARAKAAEAKSEKVGGDLTTGDGLLMGGTLVVEKGGKKVLLNYHQDTPEGFVGNSAILDALGISC